MATWQVWGSLIPFSFLPFARYSHVSFPIHLVQFKKIFVYSHIDNLFPSEWGAQILAYQNQGASQNCLFSILFETDSLMQDPPSFNLKIYDFWTRTFQTFLIRRNIPSGGHLHNWFVCRLKTYNTRMKSWNQETIHLNKHWLLKDIDWLDDLEWDKELTLLNFNLRKTLRDRRQTSIYDKTSWYYFQGNHAIQWEM